MDRLIHLQNMSDKYSDKNGFEIDYDYIGGKKWSCNLFEGEFDNPKDLLIAMINHFSTKKIESDLKKK